MRVLVIDDNPVNLKLAADVLEADGIEVDRAADAEEAQAVLEHHLPDLVLMDIALPGMDGLSLTRLLKGQDRYRRLPIVALTASAMKGDEARAIDAGCDAYITKPIDTRTFARAVRSLVPSARHQED